ncbi:MAG: hypothetical protein PHI32_06335 [Dysgonamonadaceae bacterium]|nr:hypothetical protein [Dysgonamonadaceae bacterium]
MLWSQKVIKDKVKRRAEGFASANIDTAMNYGFHVRFDYSNYFGRLNEYFNFVKEELHQYDIKFIEHYSCNHVHQPKTQEEKEKLHRSHRHHVLLFHDPEAAEHAQYEGHLFKDLFEVDIIDGSRGYSRQYYMDAFCHNNPGFLDMHKKYLERLIREVDFDGYEIDDMCDYVGLRACGCKFCTERFKRDYGQKVPPVSDKSFWGDMTKPMLYWGNYDNPVFRDWINMKDDIIADHVDMVKQVVGKKPLFTCCSATGPIVLNSISLNLERIADKLDFYMLENVGINTRSVNWGEMDAEALQQKDIAKKRGDSPAIALSYTIYPDGGYLGWSLARFWGVANWASTFNHRVYEEDPADSLETEDVIRPYNNWEVKHSNLNHHVSNDFPEVRLVYNYYCRINGWRDQKGVEHWAKTKMWSKKLLENNIGYRILRYIELADAELLLSEKSPLLLDGVASLSDNQYNAIEKYISKGGIAWVSLPFGTHDEKGNIRQRPLSDKLMKNRGKNLKMMDSISDKSEVFQQIVLDGDFSPIVRQVSGDKGWVVRLRDYNGNKVLHFMNSKLKAIPHPIVKDISQSPVLDKIESEVENNRLKFEIDDKRFNISDLSLYSPELEGDSRKISLSKVRGKTILDVDLTGIRIYAVAH